MQHTTVDGVRLSEKDSLAQICEQAAKEIGRMLLSDVKHLAEDMRQQYRDHNKLLAQQELILQQLVGQMQKLSEQNLRNLNASRAKNGVTKSSPWRIGTPLCTEPESTMSDDVVDNFHQVSTPTHTTPRAMSPRPSPAPPVPHQNPHASPENTHDDVLNPLEESTLTLTERNTPSTVKFSTSDVPQCIGDVDKELSKPEGIAEHSIEDSWMNKTSAKSAGSRRSHVVVSMSSSDQAKNKGSMARHSTMSKMSRSSATRGHPARGSYKAARGDMFGNFNDEKKLDQEEYNVCDYYWDTGYCQKIARSDLFANVTLAVIGVNAIFIGIDADRNDEDNLLDAHWSFLICENAFCTFFTFEWLMRYGSFKRKRDSMKDMWFVFDTCLVTMMVIETWILPFCFAGGTGIPTGLVKMLRLLRLARMARVMRAFPDLMAMIKGVGVASRAVGSALLMLILLVYVFSIILFTLLKDETNPDIKERFNRLGLVMWTLLIDGAFMDGIGFISRAMIRKNRYLSIAVLVVFVLCSALTVMNMLIGVLCQVVSAVAASEKEDHAIRTVKSELLSMLKEMDEDCSGLISRDEMSAVLHNEGALHTLVNLHVDVDVLMDQLEMKFEEYGELTIHAIMDLILMLRGDRPPTMKDMLESLTFNRWKIGQLTERITQFHGEKNARTSETETMPSRREGGSSSLVGVESTPTKQASQQQI